MSTDILDSLYQSMKPNYTIMLLALDEIFSSFEIVNKIEREEIITQVL